MAQNQVAYGFTTFKLAIGASAVVGLSGGPGVFDMVITGVTGGVCHYANASFATSGSLIAIGSLLPPASLPLSIGGPVPCYFASVAACEVSGFKMLSAAYDLTIGSTAYAY